VNIDQLLSDFMLKIRWKRQHVNIDQLLWASTAEQQLSSAPKGKSVLPMMPTGEIPTPSPLTLSAQPPEALPFDDSTVIATPAPLIASSAPFVHTPSGSPIVFTPAPISVPASKLPVCITVTFSPKSSALRPTVLVFSL
jgi:hypothetical protein